MAQTPDSLPPDVVAALKLGKPIEAIKRLRKSTGIGLAEAKAIVDAFNSGKTAYQRPDQNRQRPPAQPAAAAAAVAAEAVSERQQTAPPSDDLSAISLRNMGLGEVQHSNASFWLVVFLAFVALIGYVALSR